MENFDAEMTKAAQEGDLAALQRLKAAGARVEFGAAENPLLQAACKGHVACIAWLLDEGADINRADNNGAWTPLMCAAYYGFPEAAALLLERGARRDLRNTGGQTAMDCARGQGKTGVVRVFESNPNEVIFCYPLADRTLQEIFNFPRRERVTLVRKGEEGPVEAMQRDSFSALDDLTGLRKAFAEHKRRGGKLEEADVFPSVLAKPKLKIRDT